MASIKWEKDENVAIIKMCNGPNKQDLTFALNMHRCFDEILEDEAIHAIILTSTDEKNFSQGIDTDWLGLKMIDNDFSSVKEFLHGMNNIFKRMLLMPIPIISAINGHAFGNGALLACASDFRFMLKYKGFFCFPEVDINIPFLSGMIAFVRKAIPEYQFNEMILSGKRVVAEELEASHVIVKACENRTELDQEAVLFAKTFQKQRGIFGTLKNRMHKHIVTIMESEDVVQIDNLAPFIA